MIKNKGGVSTVVETILLIALTIGIVAIVWTVVSNLVEKNISSSESCFGVFEKVTLNPRYTCYNNVTGTGNDEVWFSISLGDIEKVDDILVAISGEGNSASFKIMEDKPAGLSYYPDRTRPVVIPRKSQGLTYIYELPSSFTQTPERIEIAAIVDGEVCGNINPLEQFESCSSLG